MTHYTHGAGIDELLAAEQKGKVYYYHADGLGSITALTDERGRIVQEYYYDSFGNMKHHGDKVKQPYTFTGREWDKETGLYYYRARYYDAEAGRFISFDPILHPTNATFKSTFCNHNSDSLFSLSSFTNSMKNTQALNLYIYVQNRPVVLTDPSGLGSNTECEEYVIECLNGNSYACLAIAPCLSGFPWQNTNSPQNKCIRNCLLDDYNAGCKDFTCQIGAHAKCFNQCRDQCPE